MNFFRWLIIAFSVFTAIIAFYQGKIDTFLLFTAIAVLCYFLDYVLTFFLMGLNKVRLNETLLPPQCNFEHNGERCKNKAQFEGMVVATDIHSKPPLEAGTLKRFCKIHHPLLGAEKELVLQYLNERKLGILSLWPIIMKHF